MMAFTDSDYTKPSRVKRKLKRRWKKTSIIDVIKSGLTDCYRLAQYSPAPHCANGRRNLLRIGEKSPQYPKAAFLCPSLWHVYTMCLSAMADCLGSVRRWLHLFAVFDPTQSAAHVVESMTGGLSLSRIGFTA